MMKNKKSADDSLKSFANNGKKKKTSSLPKKEENLLIVWWWCFSTVDTYPSESKKENQILMLMTEAINFSMKIDFFFVSSIKSSIGPRIIFLMSRHILIAKFYCHFIANVLWAFSTLFRLLPTAFVPNMSIMSTISSSSISKLL